MNEALLNKIRALLAKAESTPFPEEQAVFFAKAQELISRHAVDRSLLSDVQAGVAHRRVEIVGAYPASQVKLWAVLAEANGVFSLRSGYRVYRTVELFGEPADMDMATLLFGVVWRQLSVAADAAVAEWRAGFEGVGPTAGEVRSWRSSFQRGYAAGVRDALREANRTVASSSTAAGLVLVDRLSASKRLADDMYAYSAGGSSRAVLDRDALHAGHSAGRQASFAVSSLSGGRPALTG